MNFTRSRVEGPLLVHGVESACGVRRDVQHPRGDDAQARGLEAAQDFADSVLAHRIGLDDGEGSFGSLVVRS